MEPEQIHIIRDFLASHTLMTLSTVTPDGRSQSAAVEYCETDGWELIFDTFSTSRKYQNLQRNNAVSCVIVDGKQTIQCEGTAIELNDQEAQQYKALFFTKLPRGDKFDQRPETRYFKITLNWLRYSDFSVNPWEVIEPDLT